MITLRAALLVAVTAAPLAAQNPDATRPIWGDRPDAAALTRDTERRLTEARRIVDAVVARKGRRTVANTLVPYDRALKVSLLAYSRSHASATAGGARRIRTVRAA